MSALGRSILPRQLLKSFVFQANIQNRISVLQASNFSCLATNNHLNRMDKPIQFRSLQTHAPNIIPEEAAFFLQEPKQSDIEKFSSSSSHPPPLVVLFGWAGASHKNLDKYSRIYRSLGCTTAQYILPTRFIFQDSHLVPTIMTTIHSSLELSSLLSSRPVVIHCLSDTGVLCYQGLTNAMESRGAGMDLRGVVWDSCPGPYPVVTLPRIAAFLIVYWVCSRRDGLGVASALSSNWRLLVDRAWPNYLRKLLGLPVELSTIQGKWMGHFGRDHPGPTPELFIYSDTDFYLSAAYLEKEVLPLREGRDCRTLKLSNSSHVCHLKHHKEEYTRQITDFVNDKCYDIDRTKERG